MGLDHKNPASKEKNAVIIQTWIREGLHKSAGEIQKALRRQNELVANYSEGSLTRRLAYDWRPKIRKELEWRQNSGQIPSPVTSVDFSVAKEIYHSMMRYDRCGRQRIFGQHFVKEVSREVDEYRVNGLPLFFSCFVGLCKKVAKKLDGVEPSSEGAEEVAEEGTFLWKVQTCHASTVWHLMKYDCGYIKREGSSSEPLPYKHKEMGEVFVGKLLSIIKDLKVPPELLLNLDQ